MSGDRRGGFALLITITLLSFLVLLLVSMASLTRVETQVASNSQQLASARQNALMALNIALGQLQKTAGPDQRVTAIADIKGTATGAADSTIKNPYYTGVWNSTPSDPILPPTLTASTPLAWLVSGTAPSITTDYSTTGALLVGSHTVLNSGQYVYAPKVDISSSQVSGLGGANTTIGRVAYWVGDEGVKARVNLTDRLEPHPAGSTGSPAAFTPTATQSAVRLSAAQRPGVETISGLAEITQIHNEDDTAVTAQGNLQRILDKGQLPLFDTTWSASSKRDRLRDLYHDLSAVSKSVLTDTANGGLRADLTYLFEQSTDAKFLTEINKVLTGNNAIGASGQSDPTNTGLVPKLVSPATTKYSWAQGPTWYQLRSFYLSGKLTSATPAGALNAAGEAVPRAQTPDVHGISPIMTQYRMRIGMQARQTEADKYRLEGVFSPLVVLANPYDVPIAAQNYLVKGLFWGQSDLKLNNTVTSGWGSTYLATIYFRIEGARLAPGEARVYTLRAGDTSAGWDAALGCYTWANGGRYPMENDLNLDDARIAVSVSSAPTITRAELNAGVGNNTLMAGGAYFAQLFLDDGSNGNPTPSRLLQRLEASFGAWVDASGNFYGDIPIGTLSASGTPSYVLKWPSNVGDSFGYHLAGPLEPPPSWMGGVNCYQSVNWRSFLRGWVTISSGGFSTGSSGLPFGEPIGWRTNLLIKPDNTTVFWGMRNSGSNAPAYDSPTGNGNAPAALDKAIFFDLPTPTAPVVSLGQLQHFNDTGFPSSSLNLNGGSSPLDSALSASPAYAIGNSHASPFVARTAYDGTGYLKDASYLLNRTLWDTWFFSTVPQAGTFDFATDLLGNPRLTPFRSTLASNAVTSYRNGPYAASSNLLLEGGFNINSTSIEAWRALFSSLNQIPYPGTTTKLTGAFARTLKQPGGIPTTTTGNNAVSDGAWSGYRNLTTDQIDALATEMVKQVRLRGPFASLADFVNRRLDNTSNGLMGALEAAIEATEGYAASKRINNITDGKAKWPLYFNPDPPMPSSSKVITAHNESTAVAGIPGILKQADLLQALGPVITARSDTFTIRSYGEVLDPVNSTAANPVVISRAWCEAIVQRLPDYVGGESPETSPTAPTLSAESARFGRRFQVVSFRWLSPDDI
ncbi:MAG: hypothetical protein JF599_07395 [Verrucomicrobia bacterium]|nr:hypothetical protein [Verrucomicrobiota bacterium]